MVLITSQKKQQGEFTHTKLDYLVYACVCVCVWCTVCLVKNNLFFTASMLPTCICTVYTHVAEIFY